MWEELGIPETSDLKAIRKAYAARLKSLNKTGGDQAFALLHAAYQRAIARAEGKTHVSNAAAFQTIFANPVQLAPVAPAPVAPVPDADELAMLGARIQNHLAAGEYQSAIDAFDRGMAQGILPLGVHGAWFDQIMETALRMLEPTPFIALAKSVGWHDSPSWGATSIRAAVASRLDAENWYFNLASEAAGGDLWPILKGTPVPYWLRASVRHRFMRRNAKLLLVDRPQLVRYFRHSVADLRGKLDLYQRHQAWLASRVSERCVARTVRILAFDDRWGKTIRRAMVALVLIAGLLVIVDSVLNFHADPAGGAICFFLLLTLIGIGQQFSQSMLEATPGRQKVSWRVRWRPFRRAVYILIAGSLFFVWAAWYRGDTGDRLISAAFGGLMLTAIALGLFTLTFRVLKRLWRWLKS